MKIISLWPKLHCFFPCYLCSSVYFLAFLEQLYACMGGWGVRFSTSKTKSASEFTQNGWGAFYFSK